MADNFSSSYNETKSFDGETTTEKRIQQRKNEKKLPRTTKKTHIQKKDSGSDYKSNNRQRSGQSTILVLKPELISQEKEKETKKEIEKKLLKKENQENELNKAKNEDQQDKPKNEKECEQKIPDELKDRYLQETGKRSLYKGKITKGFDEWLKSKAKSEQEKQKDQETEEKEELIEDWEKLLETWINEADEKEIPKEIRKELIEKIRKYREFRKVVRRLNQLLGKEILSEKKIREIEELIKDLNEIQDDLFDNLRTFRNFYNNNIGWFEYRIQDERVKFVKHLAQKLKKLKKIENFNIERVSREQAKENWKEILKENLYKNATLRLNEKSLILKTIKKDKLDEDDKEQLISVLSKLPTEDLISLLGNDFRQHTQKYIKWGWDFDLAVKKLMIQNFLNITDLVLNLGENDLTSELIGILLGDGNLFSKNYQNQLDISLNRIDDPKYVSYVKNLMETLLNREIKISKQKGKGISLRVYSKLIIKTLVNLGLKVGNKVKNQVGVPDLIFKNKSFIIRCLKGLFDTDGSINIENKRAIRLSFQNCSKTLVEDFYRMCLALDIIPSPTIRYDEKRFAWRVDIAKKDSIVKFFQICKPEKLKEPLRRIWIASKLIYLNSSESEQQIIRNKIKSWLKQNNKKVFNYSKKSALFLKNTCEKTLGISIDIDLINKTISKVLELEKYMYDKSRAEHLKVLYEKLRSTLRIVEYLIDQGVVNIPHRQTITTHLKKFFEEKNLDYQKWLNENPKMRIGINEDNQIRVFPNELRNLLNEIICRILMEYKNKISETRMIKLLKQEFENQDLIIMTWLLNSPKYNQPTYQYLNNLIFLNKILIENYINKEKTNITLLSKDPHVPFDRRTITIMVNHLIKIGILKHDE